MFNRIKRQQAEVSVHERELALAEELGQHIERFVRVTTADSRIIASEQTMYELQEHMPPPEEYFDQFVIRPSGGANFF